MDIAQRAVAAENSLRKGDLARMKWIATGLLGVALCLYVISQLYHWAYLAAFAEAAMIGALADWFAVVALFRHPLGLPIPHTDIVTRNKTAIGNSLADFVVVQFLSQEVITQRLSNYDAARHLSQWLPANRKKAEGYIVQALMYGVKMLDDKRIHDFLAEAARNKLQSIDLSGFLANGLDLVTQTNRHRNILHGGLHRCAAYLENDENTDKVSAFIKGWSDNAFIQSMIEPFVPTIRAAVVKKLREVADDQDNGIYIEFDEQVKKYVFRLQQDAQLQQWVIDKKNSWLHHPEFAAQIESLWQQFHDWIVLDLSGNESILMEKLGNLLDEMERNLLSNESLRLWLNDQIQTSLILAANANKGQVGDLIRDEFANWDDKSMVNRLELYLGRDLQYIRINGTLVGGLFGLLIYTVTMWMAGI